MKNRLIILVVCAGAANAIGISTAGSEANSYQPDLSFVFKCNEINEEKLVKDALIFLKEEGFATLDKRRAALSKGDPAFFSVDLLSIDSQERTITITTMPMRQFVYTASLTTKPPTIRASDIEEKLSNFVKSVLKCSIQNVERRSNDQSSIALFEKTMQIYKYWFAENHTER